MQSRLIWIITVVFSNDAILSASDKYDSVNKRNQEISELIKLYIQGVWPNAHKFIRQLAHYSIHTLVPYDLDLSPLTLKTLSAMLTHMINICAKFPWNLSTK